MNHLHVKSLEFLAEYVQPPIHDFMRCHKEKVSVRSAVRFMERISIHMAVFSGK